MSIESVTMSDILVRDVDEKTVELLKALATRHGKSLQAELKRILDEQARLSDVKANIARFEAVRALTAGINFDNIAEEVREDRDRDE